MAILWAKLILCAALIVIFGLKLSKTAQSIVKAGHLSEGLMGLIVLAVITSFPEIWTSLATVTKVDAPDLGVGDLIGSVIFNIMVIAALDIKFGKKPLLASVDKTHLPLAGFSLLTLGIIAASLSLDALGMKRFGVLNVGIESIVIPIVYAACILTTWTDQVAAEHTPAAEKAAKPRLYITLIVCGGAIIASGFWLAYLGKEIVDLTGLDEMYFGTIAIALITSLPEIVVSLAAVSIGSPNMALANILGSNLFNILCISVMDIIYKKGFILEHVSVSHLYSTVMAILLTTVLAGSILYRPKRSFMRLGATTVLLLLIFFAGNIFLFNIAQQR
jgi:cation:H+ antiporter